MSAPALCIAHGGTDLLLTASKVRRRRNDLDTGEFEFDSDTEFETSLRPGSAVPIDKYAGLIITEHEPETDGTSYTHRVSAVGAATTKPEKLISRTTDDILEGFDTGTETWLTTNRRKLVRGARMSGYPNMVCMNAPVEDIQDAPGWYRVTGNFKGLLALSKPVKRAISSNVQMVQKDNLIVLFSGGWTTPQNSQILWPTVTVTFTYWTTYTPTKYLPNQGGVAPGNFFPVIEYNITGSELTYHWPNGWRLISFAPNPISGTTITETVEVWEFQQKITF